MGMRSEPQDPASPIIGDLLIKFKIVYPEIITEEQRKVISEIL